ncbi:MAG TPA: hypothetical protein VHO06_13860 [Polyangia bacterium]|nr:hypothetical protein [Polyangia bacterium]
MSTGREAVGLSKRIRRLEKPEDDTGEVRVVLHLPANGRDLPEPKPIRGSRLVLHHPERLRAAMGAGATEDAAWAASEMTPAEVERFTAEVDR